MLTLRNFESSPAQCYHHSYLGVCEGIAGAATSPLTCEQSFVSRRGRNSGGQEGRLDWAFAGRKGQEVSGR